MDALEKMARGLAETLMLRSEYLEALFDPEPNGDKLQALFREAAAESLRRIADTIPDEAYDAITASDLRWKEQTSDTVWTTAISGILSKGLIAKPDA